MANIFNSVKIKLQKKNKFNLSYASRLTTEFGRLTPIMCEETLPNDTFRIRSILRCQFAPMKFPVMQKFTAYIHYFFVPRRLLMDDWENFITGGETGVEEVQYPTVALTEELISEFGTRDDAVEDAPTAYLHSSSLYDYLGFPTYDEAHGGIYCTQYNPDNLGVNHQIDALPFKAYQFIYNEWYRDQNLRGEVELFTDINGYQNLEVPDTKIKEWFKLRNRAWKKDYFTSALPDPQRGPDVTLPLISGTDIVRKSDAENQFLIPVKSENGSIYREEDDEIHEYSFSLKAGQTDNLGNNVGRHVVLDDPADDSELNDPVTIKGIGETSVSTLASRMEVSSSGSRSATINEVRRAFAIQRWYELAARAGNRYIESILGHFGIRSSDARLQRPEYIGGSVVAVNIGDVLQTSESGDTPLGTPAGIAQAMGACKKIRYTCEEHGYIMGILSIIPEASYPQGLPRKYQRRDKFDFAWPLLANIGEQEINRSELYYDLGSTPGGNDRGFGYAPRYAEYKFNSGQVHGDFRTSLADFHDARFFDSPPALNDEFIEVSTSNDVDGGLNRIFAVQQSTMEDHLWVSMYNDIVVRRVLPKYGTPI